MLNKLIERYPLAEEVKNDIEKATEAIIECFEQGGKLLLCGNGGSAADCEHVSGELMKGFLKKRPLSEDQKAEMRKRLPDIGEDILSGLQGGLPAVSLPSMLSFNTAFCNDADPVLVYAQAVLSLGRENDILFAISTSGSSQNVCAAAKTARALGLKVIGLTGQGGGELKSLADICICVPETETYIIQELHLPVYHCICAGVEKHFFSE
ncbi:MAG: SIS domain-containing protein [Clostridia bacterium]|nr:SIS domain-containing protein [Clostridia bacterium]